MVRHPAQDIGEGEQQQRPEEQRPSLHPSRDHGEQGGTERISQGERGYQLTRGRQGYVQILRKHRQHPGDHEPFRPDGEGAERQNEQAVIQDTGPSFPV
jgi:hypothetical protein